MNKGTIFLYEQKHFFRNPFKVIALGLFILAGLYGLHNGATLYHKQIAEIEKINAEVVKLKQETIGYYERGETGPKDRPWENVTNPYNALWNASFFHCKTPSPALVYSIGQAEQYGFYKKINVWASPYDSDMAEEIANPERMQTGTLDFSFVLLYLLPLLLLILLYNIKGAEAEQGFLSLIEVQVPSNNTWLFVRVAFYTVVVFFSLVLLLLYGTLLTPIWEQASSAIGQVIFYALLYLIFWTLIFYFLLRNGKSITANTLKMVGCWLLFAFLIPATVHQWVSITKPANMMTDVIDVRRDEVNKVFDSSDSIKQIQLFQLYPELAKSPIVGDEQKMGAAIYDTELAIINDLMKKGIAPVEKEQNERNELIRLSYWFNPLTFFQNQLNSISQTHFNDYQRYRSDIQLSVDKCLDLLVMDTWNEVVVNKERYLEYFTR